MRDRPGPDPTPLRRREAEELDRLSRAADDAEWERDLAILKAVDRGVSIRTVSRAVKINHTTVRNIVKRTREVLDGTRETRRDAYIDPDGGWPRPPAVE